MKDIEYDRQLNINTRLRAKYQVDQGKVKRFTVQLEVFSRRECRPVVRYDTSHGFAHRELYLSGGKVKKADIKMTFEEALMYALDDLRDNWESYSKKFLRR